MKRLSLGLVIATVWLLGGSGIQAQYGAPSQYFPKNNPIPIPGKQPNAPKQTPAAPQQAKFKDLPINTQFYFVTDTNRAYAWTKVSETAAKNAKSGRSQAINGTTPVQR